MYSGFRPLRSSSYNVVAKYCFGERYYAFKYNSVKQEFKYIAWLQLFSVMLVSRPLETAVFTGHGLGIEPAGLGIEPAGLGLGLEAAGLGLDVGL